jgi:hypothetical protein
VVAGLDLASTHTVYVYFDDEVVQSWRLDFEALHSHAAHVWRAAGSWRMEAIDPASCRREAPNE